MRTFVPLKLYNTKLHSSKIVFWNSFDKTVGHKVSQRDFQSDFSYWLEKNVQGLRNLFIIVHDGIFSKWIINNLASLKQG